MKECQVGMGTSVVIIVIIIAFSPYLSIGHLKQLSKRPDPGQASQVVPRCNPSLLQPPDRGTTCFLGGLAFSFPVGSKSGLNMLYRSSAFGECVQSISSIFGGFYLLLVVAWSVSWLTSFSPSVKGEVLITCWHKQAACILECVLVTRRTLLGL